MHAHDESRREEHARRAARRPPTPEDAAEVGPAAGRLSPDELPALQRAIGNAAVARLVTGRPGEAPVQRSSVPDVLKSSGRPLDEPTRIEMEARLGADFSDVRVHTDSSARRSAAEVGARAYTSGNHVVLGQGGADPHTLAHELTHVIQQRSGPVAGTDRGDGVAISDPDDRFERAAEANATRAMSGPAPAAPTPSRPPAPARDGVALQRAEVSGVRHDGKTATEIGDDVHAYLQQQFLGAHRLSDLYELSIEVPVGNGRADLVAIKSEIDGNGEGDLYIYVGEIKSASNQFYAGGAAQNQLANYINNFRQEFRNDFARAYRNAFGRDFPIAETNVDVHVGRLTFWNTESEGYPFYHNGYNCVLYVTNEGNGLYRYSGRSTAQGQVRAGDRIEDEGLHPLPL